MFETLHATSRYVVAEESAQWRRYTFFCELSGAPVCTTGQIPQGTAAEMLRRAWEEAKPLFNGCAECGRWVSDGFYNPDEMKCVACAPYRRFCTDCGAPIGPGSRFCTHCGKRAAL